MTLAPTQTAPADAPHPAAPVLGPGGALVEELDAILNELTPLVESETAALGGRPDLPSMHALVDAKQTLIGAYEKLIRRLQGEPTFKQELDEEAREVLIGKAEALDRAMDANAKALKNALSASERVMGVITDAARQAAGGVELYGARGASATSGGLKPVAIDTAL